MGFLYPNDGFIKLLGQTVSDHNAAVRQEVGYLSGDVVLPKGVTGHKLLKYLGQLSGGVEASYLKLLTDRFEAQLDKPLDQLSKGNRQKVGILQAFMHQPKVFVLDEPTSGLDPLMQEQFYKTVAEVRAKGAAVLLSSHSFDEVERICDRIGIIHNGKLVYQGSVTQIAASHLPRWRVGFKHAADAGRIKNNPAIKILSADGAVIVLEPAKSIEAALGALSKFQITSMTIYQRELEEEFLSFYSGARESKQ
jgi:ABC-2 type transport system ATP-binding protein